MEDVNIEDILEELNSKDHYNPGARDPVTDFSSYIRSIDWKEPWLICLICFHIFMFIIVLISRRAIGIQATIGLAMLGVVYFSETINEVAAHYWRQFSKEQYFDGKGMFISTVLSAPLLFNCLIIIINFLLYNCQLITDIQQLKTKSVRKKVKDELKSKDSKPAAEVKGEDKKSK